MLNFRQPFIHLILDFWQIECFMVSKEATIYWCNYSVWRIAGECWQNAPASTFLFVVSGLNSDEQRDVGWRIEFYNLWDSFINEGILLNCSVRLGDTLSPAQVFETTAAITALYPCRFFRTPHPGHHHPLRGKERCPRPRRLFLLPNTTIDNNLRSQSNDRRLGGQAGLGTVGCGPRGRAHGDSGASTSTQWHVLHL